MPTDRFIQAMQYAAQARAAKEREEARKKAEKDRDKQKKMQLALGIGGAALGAAGGLFLPGLLAAAPAAAGAAGGAGAAGAAGAVGSAPISAALAGAPGAASLTSAVTAAATPAAATGAGSAGSLMGAATGAGLGRSATQMASQVYAPTPPPPRMAPPAPPKISGLERGFDALMGAWQGFQGDPSYGLQKGRSMRREQQAARADAQDDLWRRAQWASDQQWRATQAQGQVQDRQMQAERYRAQQDFQQKQLERQQTQDRYNRWVAPVMDMGQRVAGGMGKAIARGPVTPPAPTGGDGGGLPGLTDRSRAYDLASEPIRNRLDALLRQVEGTDDQAQVARLEQEIATLQGQLDPARIGELLASNPLTADVGRRFYQPPAPQGTIERGMQWLSDKAGQAGTALGAARQRMEDPQTEADFAALMRSEYARAARPMPTPAQIAQQWEEYKRLRGL